MTLLIGCQEEHVTCKYFALSVPKDSLETFGEPPDNTGKLRKWQLNVKQQCVQYISLSAFVISWMHALAMILLEQWIPYLCLCFS